MHRTSTTTWIVPTVETKGANRTKEPAKIFSNEAIYDEHGWTQIKVQGLELVLELIEKIPTGDEVFCPRDAPPRCLDTVGDHHFGATLKLPPALNLTTARIPRAVEGLITLKL